MLPYSKKVIEHFKHPKNVGKIKNPSAMAIEGSPACGDMIKIYLRINKKTKVIEDIKFESYGCASNIATASILTEMVKGKTIDEAKKIKWADAAKALGGLPPIKMHCAVLAVDALKSAIEQWEEKHGLVPRVPTTPDKVRRKLKGVINPLTGLSIVKAGLLRDVRIEDGKVEIDIDLPKDHQFASHLKEEIQEKIGHLWDVKKVKVNFIG